MSIEYPCVYWKDGKCKKFSDDKVTSWCVESPCDDQAPSNADRIRAMSDEELAEVLAFGLGCLLKAPHCMDTDCRPCYLKWLKQLAE